MPNKTQGRYNALRLAISSARLCLMVCPRTHCAFPLCWLQIITDTASPFPVLKGNAAIESALTCVL